MKKSNIPNKEIDFITVAKDAFAKWGKETDFKLKWITPIAFRAAIQSFEASFDEKSEITGSRRVATKELRNLNAEITLNIKDVKVYLTELYRKDAVSHYSECGIIKINNSYKLPADNEKRLKSLEQLIKGIEKNNLDEKQFGKAYWSDIKIRYGNVLAEARTADGQSSQQVNNKKEQRLIIRKTLNALIGLIKSNYPDTYKGQLRAWGFLKERY